MDMIDIKALKHAPSPYPAWRQAINFNIQTRLSLRYKYLTVHDQKKNAKTVHHSLKSLTAHCTITMKLSIAAVSSFVAATVAASLPEAFTLVAEGGKTVLTDGSKLALQVGTCKILRTT